MPHVVGVALGAGFAAGLPRLGIGALRPARPALAKARKTVAAATLPIRAADLMPDLQGPALGATVKTLETPWIASDFTLSHDQSLTQTR